MIQIALIVIRGGAIYDCNDTNDYDNSCCHHNEICNKITIDNDEKNSESVDTCPVFVTDTFIFLLG